MSLRIREQADEFFNAYRILKESNLALIGNLEKLAGKPLNSKTAFGSASAMGVNIVCLAFSMELYLKDLYFVLNGEIPRGHNILDLYKELPEKIRHDIFDHEAISQNPFHTRGDAFSIRLFDRSYTLYERFLDQIKVISNAFVEWRYSYEHLSLHYDESLALALIEAVKSVTDAVRLESVNKQKLEK